MSHVLSVQIQSNATCQKLLRAFFNWCLQICWPCICSGVLNTSYQTIITHLEAAQNCCSPTSGLCDTNYIFCKIKNREDHRHEKNWFDMLWSYTEIIWYHTWDSRFTFACVKRTFISILNLTTEAWGFLCQLQQWRWQNIGWFWCNWVGILCIHKTIT